MGGYLQGIVVNRMAFPFLTLFFIQCDTNNPKLQPTFNANYHVHNSIGKFTIHTDDKCRDLTNLFATEYSIKRPTDDFAELITSRIPLVGVCRPHFQIQTQFQTKKCHFPYPFPDLASKIQTRFQTWPCTWLSIAYASVLNGIQRNKDE